MDFSTKIETEGINSESEAFLKVKSDTEENLNSSMIILESFPALETRELSNTIIPSPETINDNLSNTCGSGSTDSKVLNNINSVNNNGIKSDDIQMQKELITDNGTSSEKSSLLNNTKINKFRHVVTENQERINFLLQASNYLNNIDNADNFTNESASLGSLASAIGRKCVLRMSPSLKRQLCKGCGSALLPALSSKYRLRNNRQKHLVVTCNKCKTIKRFVTNPNYVLWADKTESNV